MVKCTLVNDVVVLDSLNVTATTQKDWDMLVRENVADTIESECTFSCLLFVAGSQQLPNSIDNSRSNKSCEQWPKPHRMD